jgi:short-subunit dehydrogenase
MKINTKVIVVTGAGSGMGRELAIQLVKKGAKVALVDINEDSLRETASLCGDSFSSIHVLSIADQAAVHALPEEVIKAHGQVDAIINNAGIIQPFVDVNELDYAVIERVMNINFMGTVYMTKAFLPHLLNRPEAHIANVASMGGFIPFPGQTVYSASKAAMKTFTEGLYGELKETNVGVTIILPGAVNTNIMSNSGLVTKEEEAKSKENNAMKALAADKAAAIMIKAIESNQFSVLVGSDARFLNFLYRLAPRFAVNFIVKQMAKLKKKS